jgi:hypothetical protein
MPEGQFGLKYRLYIILICIILVVINGDKTFMKPFYTTYGKPELSYIWIVAPDREASFKFYFHLTCLFFALLTLKLEF